MRSVNRHPPPVPAAVFLDETHRRRRIGVLSHLVFSTSEKRKIASIFLHPPERKRSIITRNSIPGNEPPPPHAAPLNPPERYCAPLCGSHGMVFYPKTVAIARQEQANTINSNSTVSGNNSSTSVREREKRRVKGIEERSLSEVMSEGITRVARLSECVVNATQRGLFGKEPQVTYCR